MTCERMWTTEGRFYGYICGGRPSAPTGAPPMHEPGKRFECPCCHSMQLRTRSGRLRKHNCTRGEAPGSETTTP